MFKINDIVRIPNVGPKMKVIKIGSSPQEDYDKNPCGWWEDKLRDAASLGIENDKLITCIHYVLATGEFKREQFVQSWLELATDKEQALGGE